jgi:hypothetical protein
MLDRDSLRWSVGINSLWLTGRTVLVGVGSGT